MSTQKHRGQQKRHIYGSFSTFMGRFCWPLCFCIHVSNVSAETQGPTHVFSKYQTHISNVRWSNVSSFSQTHCNTLQHTATHCNTQTLQHTLQHTATHCNTGFSQTRCNTLQHISDSHFKCEMIKCVQFLANKCVTKPPKNRQLKPPKNRQLKSTKPPKNRQLKPPKSDNSNLHGFETQARVLNYSFLRKFCIFKWLKQSSNNLKCEVTHRIP